MKLKAVLLFTLLAGVGGQHGATARQIASAYDILELPPGSSSQEARRAYRRLAKQYHPDKSTFSTEEANAKFIQLREAYEVIADRKGVDETYFRESTSFNKEQTSDSSKSDASVNVDYSFLWRALTFAASSLPLLWLIAASSNKGDIFFYHAKKDKHLIQKLLKVFPNEVQQVIALNAIKQNLLSYDDLPDALKAEPTIKQVCQPSFLNKIFGYFNLSIDHDNNISDMAKAYLATDKNLRVLGCIKPTQAILTKLFECFPKVTQHKIANDLIWQNKIPFDDLPQTIKENKRYSEMNRSCLSFIALEYPLVSSIFLGGLARSLCPSDLDQGAGFFSGVKPMDVQLYTSSMSFVRIRLHDSSLVKKQKCTEAAKIDNDKLLTPAPEVASNQALGAQTKVTMSDNLRTKKTKWVKKLEQYSSCLFERNKINFGKTNEINPELKEHGSQKHRCTIS